MEFHEKSLELNITHELLCLADKWSWFLTDIPLWRYWRPRYRLPFIQFPKSTASGLHPVLEGRNDPTGKAGGGFDVRIKAGYGKHLLFVQYKKGDYCTSSPNASSEFAKSPHEHYKFKINSTSTNQHFTLRALASGIGGKNGNAVVYAFPLIKNIAEMEIYAGKLVRKTKFISIADIDQQAQRDNLVIAKGQEHNFKICSRDMNRCELNAEFIAYAGEDRTAEIITDLIGIQFQKHLTFYLAEINKRYNNFELNPNYIPFGLQQSFIQYTRYLLHYFELHPKQTSSLLPSNFSNYFYADEFQSYEGSERDTAIFNTILSGLKPFQQYIFNEDNFNDEVINAKVPHYSPSLLFRTETENGLSITLPIEISTEAIDNLMYLSI